MNTIGVVIVSDLITLVLTLTTTLLSIGIKWGRITSDIGNLKSDVSEIKGMFVLKLKE